MKYLRTFSLGELLDKSIDLYRENFKFIIGLSFVSILPLLVLGGVIGLFFVLAGLGHEYPAVIITSVVIIAVLSFLAMAAFLWGWSAQVLAVHRIVLGGELDLTHFLKEAWVRLPPILGASIIMMVPVVLVCSPCAVVLVTVGNNPSAGVLALLGAGGIVILLALYYYFIQLSMLTLAILIEHKNALESLGRSWRLVRGYWWRVFGGLIFANMLSQFCQMAFFIFYIIPVVGPILSMITYPLFFPILVIVQVLLYFDLRIRKEGWDLEILAERLGGRAEVTAESS
jgi:hypothetical protein